MLIGLKILYLMCTSPNLMYRNLSPHRSKKDVKWHFRKFHPDVLDELTENPYVNAYLIPCGRCFECRMQYAKNWAIRLTKELETSKNAYFLTITYADAFLPENNSVLKSELKKFIKDLRNYSYYHFGLKDIKYFACAEYGEKFNRIGNGLNPHYHCIIFNLPQFIVDDLKSNFPYKDEHGIEKSSEVFGSCKNKQYYSKYLEDLWSKGRICVDFVNFEACSYVARYIQKKQFGVDADIYSRLGVEPPFLIESKSIGKNWFLKHYKEIYETDKLYILKKDRVMITKPPRYFDNLLKNLDLDLFNKIKSRRDLRSLNAMKDLNEMDDMSIFNYFAGKEYISHRKNRLLVRK